VTETFVPAAAQLLGTVLPGGWRVVSQIDPHDGGTGGNFSVGYIVENADGRKGFCKALDFSEAMFANDPAEAFGHLAAAYNFERDLLRKCAESRMSRVILAIDDGVVDVPGGLPPRVNYLILELADTNIRKTLNLNAEIDTAAKLRALQNVATGLRQLHDKEIAHQDVKPSNILQFDSHTPTVSKVADLGRATDRVRAASHDDLMIAGDRAYAPPEQLYGATPVEFGARRYGCDLYQLGSLTSFLFTGVSMNALLLRHLDRSHSWKEWSGTYDEVLPYVRDAFGRSVAYAGDSVETEVRDDVMRIIGYLCEPDPTRRGHPVTLSRPGSQYSLQRTVTELDLLTRRAEVRLKNSA
jgi:eukaryotic-like serine/threonine-protein kinase